MKVNQYFHGQPCWAELATHNWSAARAFYSDLLGWEMADLALPNGAFSMFTIQGDELGAMYQMPERIQEDVQTHWSIYFAVDSVVNSIEQVEQAGGSLILGPHVIGEAGVMAQLADPEGARFAIWEAKNHIGAKRIQEIGALCWVELACRYADKEKQFYHSVFNWGSKPSDLPDFEYTEWQVNHESFGGMLEMTAEWEDTLPHWMLYLTVKDCDVCAERVEQLGGKVCVQPTSIPKVGRFAVVSDPQGGVFSIIALST